MYARRDHVQPDVRRDRRAVNLLAERLQEDEEKPVVPPWSCRALDSPGPGDRAFRREVALEPVTKQVTTTPVRQTSATYPDNNIPLNCGNPTYATPSDETGMHGKEKAYGSIP